MIRHDGVAGLLQNRLSELAQYQLGGSRVYIGVVAFPHKDFHPSRSFKGLRMDRKRERPVPLVDKVSIEAEVLQSCDRLAIAVLHHLEHEVLEAHQREAFRIFVAVEVLQYD